MTPANPRSRVRLRSGNAMPVLGIGTWQLTRDTPGAIASALELGYAMIDTSGDYGTQPGIGEGIKRSGAGRSQFYLVTKVEETDDAYQATCKELEELRLDMDNAASFRYFADGEKRVCFSYPPRGDAPLNSS